MEMPALLGSLKRANPNCWTSYVNISATETLFVNQGGNREIYNKSCDKSMHEPETKKKGGVNFM
jgi:hypothetical protein